MKKLLLILVLAAFMSCEKEEPYCGEIVMWAEIKATNEMLFYVAFPDREVRKIVSIYEWQYMDHEYYCE